MYFLGIETLLAIVQTGSLTKEVSLTVFGRNLVTIAERWRVLQLETDALWSGSSELHLSIGGAMSLNRYLG